MPAVAAVFAFSALVAFATALDTWEPLILPVIVPAVVAVLATSALSALLATDALPAKAADGTVGRLVTLSCAAVIVWFSSLVPGTEWSSSSEPLI